MVGQTGEPEGELAEVLMFLLGDKETAGLLDEYRVFITDSGGKSVIVWSCSDGYLGYVVRGTDLDQTNLTLGEVVDSVLRHHVDNHIAPDAS